MIHPTKTPLPRAVLRVAVVVVMLMPAVPAAAQQGGLDAHRRDAERLQTQIARQGELLSRATEDYNEAQLQRAGVEGKLAVVRRDLRQAEERWLSLRGQMAARVRYLYMHPGSWASVWFSDASNVSEYARGRVLAGSVLALDTDLILETERARAHMSQRQGELEQVRAESRAEENRTASHRAEVLQVLQAQRSLLAQAQGEISRIMEAERQRRLQEARRAAASAAAGTRPARAAGGLPAPKDVGPVRPAAAKAISTAAAQIGKPYEWGASGPDSFDCSGLTMYAWRSAGVSLPHSSRAQYASLPKIARDEIRPGDLLFYGNPIHHVGIYEGGGVMIAAPETGDHVRRASIYRRDYTGAARP